MGDDTGPDARFPDIPPGWHRRSINDGPVNGYITEAIVRLSAAGPPHENPPDPNPWIFRHEGPPFELHLIRGTLEVTELAPGSGSYTLTENDATREFSGNGEFEFINPNPDDVAVLRVRDQMPVTTLDDPGVETNCGGGCWGRGG